MTSRQSILYPSSVSFFFHSLVSLLLLMSQRIAPGLEPYRRRVPWQDELVYSNYTEPDAGKRMLAVLKRLEEGATEHYLVPFDLMAPRAMPRKAGNGGRQAKL
jgi:hypothetical protein